MSAQTRSRRVTCADIAKRKNGEPIVSLTAYDAPTAEILDPHCDFLLVGDSVGMVVHGLPSTVGVTLDMMIMHGKAVMRGVKIEAGTYTAEIVRFLTERGIPVMAHVGLRPQAVNVTGGFKAKGRTNAEADMVLAEAEAAEKAGAFSVVVEGVDENLAEQVTKSVGIPTIGIGASAGCDGQILVTPDMLGISDWTPKFVRKFADLRSHMDEAVASYAAAVRARTFPGDAEVYRVKKDD